MMGAVRRLLLGSPLATQRREHETLGLLGGLAVFASDALSSVAYGPEEVLIVLGEAGRGALAYLGPISIAVVVLLGIVVTSYRQTVVAFPRGGGAYAVARDNLGPLPSHIAGGALLTDYVLTVAVSTAAGVAAITSAWPVLGPWRVHLGVLAVLVTMLVNLRGLRESATMVGAFVYAFIALMLGMVAIGLWKSASGTLPVAPPLSPEEAAGVTGTVSLWLILRAFASGGATLTGIEAVADGVEAFREPRSKLAGRCLALLGLLLSAMVLGSSYLAHRIGVQPSESETVMSQIARAAYGHGSAPYYLLQTMTCVILILAANTSFNGFPRLAAFMAQGGYLPRQLTNLGDRLVYSNGIVGLALLAIGLLVAFGGEVTRLIPLYAVGVFTAFTFSQAGMVRHWTRGRQPGWRYGAIVNGIGAATTGVVLVVVAVTKFVYGAWIVCLLIPLIVLVLRATKRHYDYVAAHLTLEGAQARPQTKNLNILLVGGMNRGTLNGLQYLKSLEGTARCIHVEIEGHDNPRVKRLWGEWERDLELIIIQSPYRSYAEPLVEYIRQVQREEGFGFVTVIVPEFVVNRWWESMLHNHTATWLQIVLRSMPGVAVTNMRYRLDDQ